jgi:outer membrane murein-binding lipoprotein Lpp
LSAQAQLDAARAKLDQLFSRSEVNSGKSNPAQPLNPFTQDLQAAKSEIVAAQSKLDSAKTKLDQLLNPLAYDLQAAQNDASSARSKLDSAKTKLDQLIIPTTSDLIKEQGAVTKAKGEMAEVQEDVTKAISSHLDTGMMSGEEFDLWNLMLKAQSAVRATRARILVQPPLLTEPTVAGKEVENASAEPVEDLGIVETNTQAISTYLKELISFSQIPEAIASAMAAESDEKPLWRLPKPRFRNLKTPTPTP